MPGVPYRRFLTIRLALVVVLTGVLVGAGGLLGIVFPLLLERAESAFQGYTLATLSHLETRLLSAAKTLEILGLHRHLPQRPEHWRDFAEPASQMMRAMPLITSIVAGNEQGLGWMLLSLPNAPRLVRITHLAEWGNEHRFIELDEHLMPIREEIRRLDYDPRRRPWYRLAAQNPGKIVWTSPYLLYTTHDIGITAALGWQQDNAFAAIGLDIRLIELQELMRSLAASQARLRLAVSDANDRVIADSAAASVPLIEENELRHLAREDAPWRIIAAQAVDQSTFFWQDARLWLGVRKPIPFGEQTWQLWIAVPFADLLPEWPLWLGGWAVLTLGAIALAIFLAFRWAHQISRPVEELAKAADEIGRTRFRNSVPRRHSISELHALAFTLERMRRRLLVTYARVDRQRILLQSQLDALHAAESRLAHAGLHDSLTDLANRRLLLETARQMTARAARSNGRVALLFIDLDHFKELNDTWGHEWGDQLLIETAHRLRERARATDLVARLGGDEFVLLLDAAGHEAAKAVAGEILQVLARPYDFGKFRWSVTASIGIAVFPDDAADPPSLLRAADVAMYWAKAQGRNRAVVYSHDRDSDQRESFTLREDLRYALDREEIELWLQPQVDLKSGRLVAAEALVRWRHPQKGMIPPTVFVPLAESSGLIDGLGRWVLRRSLQIWKQVQQAGIRLQRISVNVSAVQLQREDFPQAVLAALSETGVPARALEIELTESIMADIALAKSRLAALESAGVRLAIDDFGTGYSSLSYLNALPFDVLKIDASFVRDIGASDSANAVISGLAQIGQALQLEIVAEGIETEAQRNFLQQIGVSLGQGFLLAPPMPLESFLAWHEKR